MNKKLYNLMDWAAIEEIVYGECVRPSDILGAHTVGKSTLVQAFFPGAESVVIYLYGEDGTRGKTVKDEIHMEMADEAGFFAALLPGAHNTAYSYLVSYPLEIKEETKESLSPQKEGSKKRGKSVYANKNTKKIEVKDPYNFDLTLKAEDEDRFLSGADSRIYETLGCHKKTINGVRGVVFRVWAPNAIRVSVVGNFNEWNGIVHQMNRYPVSGIFELFIPGLEEGEEYQYEILMRGGNKLCKADPVSFAMSGVHKDLSLITNIAGYKWKDQTWLKERKNRSVKECMHIYQASLPVLLKKEDTRSSLRDIAGGFAKYLHKMGYTHLEILPITEYENDDDNGFHTSAYFAPTTRVGEAGDVKAFIDAMHAEGIAVIFGLAVSDFSNSSYGLGSFDGTALYEDGDPRRGIDPRTGMFQFCFYRQEVKQYLFSVLNFWADEYHVDGYCFFDLTSSLFLDYYRHPGEWLPNIYGGNENIDAMEFFRKANQLLHERKDGLITIADERSGFSHVTGKESESLGFDLTTDVAWTRDVLGYLQNDPIKRKNVHHLLTDNFCYRYSEEYILPLNYSDIDFDQGGILERMPGNRSAKWRNLKLFHAYRMMMVGKDLTIAGQERGEYSSYCATKGLAYDELHIPEDVSDEEGVVEMIRRGGFMKYIADLNRFEKEHPSLNTFDTDPEGFVWIKDTAADENVLVFERKCDKESLIAVFHFGNIDRKDYIIGVPGYGKYKEVFSSEDVRYTGAGSGNAEVISVREQGADGRSYSIKVNLLPLSFTVYSFVPFTGSELADIAKKKKEKETRKNEEEKRRISLYEKKNQIRSSIKEELMRKIEEAEEENRKNSRR